MTDPTKAVQSKEPSSRVPRSPSAALLAACIAAAAPAGAAPSADNPFDLYFTDQYSYDDNLFRVGDSVSVATAGSPVVKSLDDYVNRASVGLQTRLDAARQVFELDLRFDDVRYANNDDLDYRGGSGQLNWDWKLASNWSGTLRGKYDRALASFSNYQFFERDVVDAATYGGDVRYAIGSRWAVLAGAAFTDTDHSAAARRIDEFKGETYRGGVEYRTPGGSAFGVDYQDTTAKFPVADSLPGAIPYRYDEQQQGLNVFYAYSAITQFRARVAYVKRDYFDPSLDDYSGTGGNVLMHWEPRTQLYFDIRAWRELTAYTDAESDYYVGDGASITPTWEPTTKIKLAGAISYEKQDYVGDNAVLLPLESGREDKVKSAMLRLDYAPRDWLSFGLSYRTLERDSNRELRNYDTNVYAANFKVTL